MSWLTEAAKINSEKILVLELDIPVKEEQKIPHLLNLEAGLWKYVITPEYVMTFPAGVLTMVENPNPDDGYDVGSVIVGDVQFVKVFTFADLRYQKESFMYDRDTTAIYFHFKDWHYPSAEYSVTKIIIGQTYLFCDKVDSINGCYYDNVYAEPRIKSAPNISKAKDPLFYGVLAFRGGSVTLDNSDGYFDNFKNLNIFRQRIALKLGFAGLIFADYRTVFTGYVEKYNWDFEAFTFSFQDIRKGLTRTIPENTFTVAEFADLGESDVDKYKPIAYGSQRNVPTICINSEGSTPFIFFVADTEKGSLTSIDAVYIDGDLIDSGDYSVSLANGTITIAAADVDGLEDNLDSITCDFVGQPETNSLEILRTIMADYNDVEYIAANYNTVEYTATEALCRDSALYLDEPKKIEEIMAQLGVDSDAWIFAQDDGKYSARVYDEAREPIKTIYADEWIEDNPERPKGAQIGIDETQFLSDVTIKYNRDVSNDKYRQYLNDDYAAETLLLYKTVQHKAIETGLVSEADAIEKSESIMAISKFVTEQVKRKTIIAHIDLEIGDFVIASPNTRSGKTPVYGIWEIIGMGKNLSKFDVELTMRHVKAYSG